MFTLVFSEDFVPFFKGVLVANAWFWPRHSRIPRVYIYKESFNKKSKKCVCSMGRFPDLMKLGAHGGLGNFLASVQGGVGKLKYNIT